MNSGWCFFALFVLCSQTCVAKLEVEDGQKIELEAADDQPKRLSVQALTDMYENGMKEATHYKDPNVGSEEGVIKHCTKECETITVNHFKEVYGPICSEETTKGQRILEKIRQHKAQVIMHKKGRNPYLDESDWKNIEDPDERDKMKARAFKNHEKKERMREKLEALSTSCDDENIELISQIDMLNNSPLLTSHFKPELNGALSENEKRDPLTYGLQCIVQCRDAEGKTSGRDMDAEQIYKPKEVELAVGVDSRGRTSPTSVLEDCQTKEASSDDVTREVQQESDEQSKIDCAEDQCAKNVCVRPVFAGSQSCQPGGMDWQCVQIGTEGCDTCEQVGRSRQCVITGHVW